MSAASDAEDASFARKRTNPRAVKLGDGLVRVFGIKRAKAFLIETLRYVKIEYEGGDK